MKTKSLLSILLVSFVQFGFCQIDTTKLGSINIKGNVREVKNMTFTAVDSVGVVVKGEFLNENYRFKLDSLTYSDKTNFYYEYDINGNQLTIGKFNSFGYLYSTKKFKYNNNQILESNEKMQFSDGDIDIKEIYKYDNNKLTSITIYRNNELLYKESFKYDILNHIIEEATIDNLGKITGKVSRKFENTNLVYEKKTDESFNNESKYIYDSLGNKTYSLNRYDDLVFESKVEYKDKLPIKELNLRNGKLESITNYVYIDNKLSIITLIKPVDKSIISYEERKYNANNEVVEILTKNEDGTIKKMFDKNGNVKTLNISTNETEFDEYNYEYFYDNRGNIIRTIEFKNSVPIKVRQITISYY